MPAQQMIVGGSRTPFSLPFPRPAIWGAAGAQLPNTPTSYQNFSQYPMGLLGGDFPSAVGGSNPTRNQVAIGCTTQPLTGKNAVRQQLFQYQDLPNQSSAGNQIDLTNKAIANNWRVWLIGSSGTLQTVDGFADGYITPCHGGSGGAGGAPIAVDPATGLWPGEWMGQYLHDRYIGTGLLSGGTLAVSDNFANMGSLLLAGGWTDNVSEYIRVSGDWNRRGVTDTNPGTSSPSSVIAALFTGQADIGKQWRKAENKAGTNRKIIGNTAAFAKGSYGFDTTPMKNAFDYGMQQFVFGRGISQQWQYHGFAYVMAQYKLMIADSLGASAFMTAQWKPGDYQAMRHAICFTSMDNGYLLGGVTSGGTLDGSDPNNTATYPVCDEFWGGAMALGGYLGPPRPTPQGAVQTAAWQNGVWRRDFQNGIILINSTQASQTVTLGGTYFHLRTTTGQAINNAAAATTVTLGTFSYDSSNTGYAGHPITTGDACILMNNPT